jgi:hypothetical protein
MQDQQENTPILDEPIPDDEHLAWLCPRDGTTLEFIEAASWPDGSWVGALICPKCSWRERT